MMSETFIILPALQLGVAFKITCTNSHDLNKRRTRRQTPPCLPVCLSKSQAVCILCYNQVLAFCSYYGIAGLDYSSCFVLIFYSAPGVRLTLICLDGCTCRVKPVVCLYRMCAYVYS